MIGLWKIKMSQGLLMSEREMRMKKLFGYAEKYIARCGWKDLAMLKFCLFAMGGSGRYADTGKEQEAGRVDCRSRFCGNLCSFDGEILFRY